MEKEEIIALLNDVICPVYQIEADLGMPKTTLQKAIKGERKLPKKWAIKLKERFQKKEDVNSDISPKEENTTEQVASDWKQQLLQLRQNKNRKQ